MSGKPENFADASRLISDLLDGRLEPAERARLELLLESDANARALYFQMIDQEVELECLAAPAGSSSPEPIISMPPASARPWRAPWLWAIAAAIILCFILWWAFESPITPGEKRGRIASSSWSSDFESGSLAGWLGEIVSEGLPAGSRFAIRAIETRTPDFVIYQVAAPENWREGFVELTENSTLHVTYRFGRAPWLNVFLHVLGSEGSSPSMFQLMGAQFPGASDRWQTASIPMRLFRRKVWDTASNGLAFVGGGPRSGERLASLSFSAPHSMDFMIDRIWITPGGEGAETIKSTP